MGDLLFICENFMFRDGSGFCANFFLLWTAWSAGSFITNTDNRCLSPIEVSLHFAKRFTCHSKRHVRGSGPLLDPHTNQKKSFCILARNIFGHDRNQMWRISRPIGARKQSSPNSKKKRMERKNKSSG